MSDDLQALSDAATDGPWVIERGAIVPIIRERPGGPQVGTAICEEDAAYIVALVNAHRETLRAATPVVLPDGLDEIRARVEALPVTNDAWLMRESVLAVLAASPSPDTDAGLDVDADANTLLAALPDDIAVALMEIMRTLNAYRVAAHARLTSEKGQPETSQQRIDRLSGLEDPD